MSSLKEYCQIKLLPKFSAIYGDIIMYAPKTKNNSIGYSFRNEPEEYYYAHPNTAQIIPCEGVETRDDGTEQLVDVIVFENSERINSDRPPDGLFPLSVQGHITGLLILSVRIEDSGSTYQCVVEVNGERVLSSVQTTLYVGGESTRVSATYKCICNIIVTCRW